MRRMRPRVAGKSLWRARLLEMHVDNCPYLFLAQTYSQCALGLKVGFKLRQLGAIYK